MKDDKTYRGWGAVSAHRAWRRALMQDRTLLDLSGAAVVNRYGVDLRLVAIVIADAGVNGYNCFPSVETIADLIGCTPRTVKKWRKILIDLGWFREVTRSGGPNHRSLVLEIAIPEGLEDGIKSSTAA